MIEIKCVARAQLVGRYVVQSIKDDFASEEVELSDLGRHYTSTYLYLVSIIWRVAHNKMSQHLKTKFHDLHLYLTWGNMIRVE